MAFSFKFRKGRPVNLMIKDHVIRFIELKQTNPLVVQSYGERYLPAGVVKNGKIEKYEQLALIFEECIDEWKLKKKRVCFHVPDSSVIIRKLPLPDDVEAEEIEAYLHMEIGTSIHLPFENPLFDYYSLTTNEREREIILFAAPEEIVADYTNLLEEAHLKPVVADITALSLYRLYNHFQPKVKKLAQQEILMIAEFDVQAINVSIFEGHLPIFMRHILMDIDTDQLDFSLNGQMTNKKVRKAITFALQDMYTELNRVLDFYRYSMHHGEKQVTKLLLTGAHPLLTEIESQLKTRLSIPIVTIDPNKLPTIEKNRDFPVSYHSLIGLGLKGV